jgi:hypothetical protein
VSERNPFVLAFLDPQDAVPEKDVLTAAVIDELAEKSQSGEFLLPIGPGCDDAISVYIPEPPKNHPPKPERAFWRGAPRRRR